MSDVYVISDLHLAHRKLAQVRGFSSMDEHDHFIINRIRSVVRKRDVIYLLGDVCFGDIDHWLPLIPGTKKLALGNHDQRPTVKYLQHCSQVRAMFVYDNCLLTHIPVSPCQFRRWDLNVHGHTHTRHMEDKRYVNVSAEALDYTPRLLNEVIRDARNANNRPTPREDSDELQLDD